MIELRQSWQTALKAPNVVQVTATMPAQKTDRRHVTVSGNHVQVDVVPGRESKTRHPQYVMKLPNLQQLLKPVPATHLPTIRQTSQAAGGLQVSADAYRAGTKSSLQMVRNEKRQLVPRVAEVTDVTRMSMNVPHAQTSPRVTKENMKVLKRN